MRRWALVLLFAFLSGCSASTRGVVRLDTGQGEPSVHTPRRGVEPVAVSEKEFKKAITQHAPSLVDGNCGHSSLHLPSTCVLRPYDEGPISERVLTASVMAAVLRAMVLAWEPEWGVVSSHQYDDLISEQVMPAGTSVGWVMYFSRLRGTVPPLPAPVRIEPVEDKGTLVILTPERFTASNPEHVTLAARVHDLLDRAGLLQPLQPWPAG
ncbi:immunity 52 family protein [Hyalangium versicolor]|uniref:immunity 52 family protein n=1 Tax=Hyalangium versicolor TaxID=2861190 RepID=UPI001CCCFE19|nr:immunity 52 family protein [Hyalangium versicolor]